VDYRVPLLSWADASTLGVIGVKNGQYIFWLYDLNFRYAIGQAFAAESQRLRGTYLELGGVNIFNNLPQYSNYYFGFIGYDAAQADIRGRFLYAQVGLKF